MSLYAVSEGQASKFPVSPVMLAPYGVDWYIPSQPCQLGDASAVSPRPAMHNTCSFPISSEILAQRQGSRCMILAKRDGTRPDEAWPLGIRPA